MSKTLPGQIYATDTQKPSEPPLPPLTMILETGTVSCINGNNMVFGSDTVFTEELTAGQSLLIGNSTVKISLIQDNNILILTQPWTGEDISNVYAYVYKLRPFSEFLGKYVYPETAPLGSSGLTLRDLMPNFKRPMRELKSNATVPNWASDPTTDPTTDGNNSNKQPPTKRAPSELPESENSNRLPV